MYVLCIISTDIQNENDLRHSKVFKTSAADIYVVMQKLAQEITINK